MAVANVVVQLGAKIDSLQMQFDSFRRMMMLILTLIVALLVALITFSLTRPRSEVVPMAPIVQMMPGATTGPVEAPAPVPATPAEKPTVPHPAN